MSMRNRRVSKASGVVLLSLIVSTFSAHAGMTVYGLSDVYRLRLQEISFFLLSLLVCAFVFKLLWNHAIKGFTSLPRITFGQSFCLAVLFGLVMLLILAMISGVREVLTPEAWRRQGSAYRLNDPSQEPVRRRNLEHLRGALFDYARNHQGRFPENDFVPEISEKLWESPDQSGSRYIYVGGWTTTGAGLLAVEPPNFGEQRFVLRTSGDIESLSSQEIQKNFAARATP